MKRTVFFTTCLLTVSFWMAGMAFPAAAQAATPAADPTKNATSIAEQPETNLRCWKQESCEYVNPKTNEQLGTWDNWSPTAKAECKGAAYGYCYSVKPPINISVSLPSASGPVTAVKDIGDYINKLYQYLLGFATTVAIVFTMIGGLRYVMAAGTGQVSEAKKQITNALSGLVLLMFAYLILFTVNPQLVRLQMPSIPKIRTILFLTETSCEALVEKGFKVDPDQTSTIKSSPLTVLCGKKEDSKVVADQNGMPIDDETQTCQWHYCGGLDNAVPGLATGIKGAQKVCLQTDTTKTGEEAYLGNSCVGCWEVTVPDASSFPKIVPSGGTCSYFNFEAPADASTTPPTPSSWNFECVYSFDPKLASLTNQYDAVTKGMCALVSYDCSQIKTCGDYDSINGSSGGYSDTLGNLITGMGIIDTMFGAHKSICESNPCKDRGDGKGVQTACVQEYSKTGTIWTYFGANTPASPTATLAAWAGLTTTGISCQPVSTGPAPTTADAMSDDVSG